MTHEELISHVRQAYLKARECAYPPSNHSTILARGSSRPISALTEDLIGCYCAERAPSSAHNRVLVEPPISFKGSALKNRSGKSALLIKPDVVLLHRDEARVFLDIKTDLGHKRKDMFDTAQEHEALLERIKGKPAHFNDGRTKAGQQMVISSNIRSYYVVLSEGNIGKLDLEGHLERIKQLKRVGVLLLTIGDHLNSYEQGARWDLNERDLGSLDAIIDRAFRP